MPLKIEDAEKEVPPERRKLRGLLLFLTFLVPLLPGITLWYLTQPTGWLERTLTSIMAAIGYYFMLREVSNILDRLEVLH